MAADIIGSAILQVRADSRMLRDGLADAERIAEGGLKGIASRLGKVNLLAAAGAAAIATAVATGAAFVKAGLAASAYGDELQRMSKSVGISAEALSGLRFVADMAGTEIGTLQGGLLALARNIDKAASGSKEMAEQFLRVGVSLRDSSGGLKSTEAVLNDVASAFARMPDGAEKARIAAALFGRAGQLLIPMLNEGAAGLAEMRKKAEELGLTFDDKAIAAAARLDESLDLARASMQGLSLTIGKAMMPAIDEIVRGFVNWYDANRAIIQQGFAQIAKGISLALQVIARSLEAIGKLTPMISSLFSSKLIRDVQIFKAGVGLVEAGFGFLAKQIVLVVKVLETGINAALSMLEMLLKAGVATFDGIATAAKRAMFSIVEQALGAAEAISSVIKIPGAEESISTLRKVAATLRDLSGQGGPSIGVDLSGLRSSLTADRKELENLLLSMGGLARMVSETLFGTRDAAESVAKSAREGSEGVTTATEEELEKQRDLLARFNEFVLSGRESATENAVRKIREESDALARELDKRKAGLTNYADLRAQLEAETERRVTQVMTDASAQRQAAFDSAFQQFSGKMAEGTVQAQITAVDRLESELVKQLQDLIDSGEVMIFDFSARLQAIREIGDQLRDDIDKRSTAAITEQAKQATLSFLQFTANTYQGRAAAEEAFIRDRAARLIAEQQQALLAREITEQQFADRRIAIEEATAQQISEIKQKEQIAEVNMVAMRLGMVANSLNQLASMQDQSSRSGFKRAQRLAAAAGMVQAIQGAIAAYTSALAAFPAPANIAIGAVMAAIALAAGIANVKKIQSQKFEGGSGANPGMVGGAAGGMDEVPNTGTFLVHKGEAILQAHAAEKVRAVADSLPSLAAGLTALIAGVSAAGAAPNALPPRLDAGSVVATAAPSGAASQGSRSTAIEVSFAGNESELQRAIIRGLNFRVRDMDERLASSATKGVSGGA